MSGIRGYFVAVAVLLVASAFHVSSSVHAQQRELKPAAQAPSQAPALQLGIGTLLLEHTTPHAPQLRTLDATSVSQPSVCLLPLQSA